mmetsp:Transcript_37906/g.81842  ORF Transcript_37906/g.81842 Transcript_37906/m.81842 type:complete len:197 (+) Transcript_37906:14-604(+)
MPIAAAAAGNRQPIHLTPPPIKMAFKLRTASKRQTMVALLMAATSASLLFSKISIFKLMSESNHHSNNNHLHNINDNNMGVPKSNNKTLVIAMGELRGGEQAWQTLYENVLNPNMADLALMTTNNWTLYPNNTLTKRARYVWYYDQYDDWADAVDLVASEGGNNAEWRTTHLPKFYDWNMDAYWGRNRSILFGGIK